MQVSLILSCLAFLACTHQGMSLEKGLPAKQLIEKSEEVAKAEPVPARKGCCGCKHRHSPVTVPSAQTEHAPVATPKAEAADKAALAETSTAPVHEVPQAQDQVKVVDAVKQEGADVKQEGAAVKHEGVAPVPGNKPDDAQA